MGAGGREGEAGWMAMMVMVMVKETTKKGRWNVNKQFIGDWADGAPARF